MTDKPHQWTVPESVPILKPYVPQPVAVIKTYKLGKYGKRIGKRAAPTTIQFKDGKRYHPPVFSVPTTFLMIDQMGAYRQTRASTQEETSYSLDAIMRKELKIGKLKFNAHLESCR